MTKTVKPSLPREGARDRLIEAARSVFAKRGIEFASVKEIARVAQANHGLVHYYFGSKDGLLLEMVRRSAAIYGEQFASLEREASGPELASKAMATSTAILRADPDRTRLHAELVSLGLRRPELHPGIAALIIDTTERTAKLVAIARGRQEATDDDRATAAVLRSAFDGLAMQLAYDPGFDLEGAVEVLKRIL